MASFSPEYDLAIFIGRFQPLHNGHCSVIRAAGECASHTLVIVGSSEGAASAKNPWNLEDRVAMVRATFSDKVETGTLSCVGVPDSPYRKGMWATRVREAVDRLQTEFSAVGKTIRKIVLFGHSKDASTWYLDQFPEWGFKESPNYREINATDIRAALFEGKLTSVSDYLPTGVKRYVEQWATTKAYQTIAEEYLYLKKYQENFASLPYPPVFVTVDAVVVQAGHLLLIQRKHAPGKGLWALPGGFLDAGECLADAANRELEEETGVTQINPSGPPMVFDAPTRGSRGRTITHAYLFTLPGSELAPLNPGSDASRAEWVPLDQVRRKSREMFEDHWHIIDLCLASVSGMEGMPTSG